MPAGPVSGGSGTETVNCPLTAGGRDYLVQVVDRDLPEFDSFLSRRLAMVDTI